MNIPSRPVPSNGTGAEPDTQGLCEQNGDECADRRTKRHTGEGDLLRRRVACRRRISSGCIALIV